MSISSEICYPNTRDNDQNNYALKVALKTMQERCRQLQQRLTIVEDENLNLRLKCGEDRMLLETDSTRSEVEILQDRVAQLTKQKLQLTHNVFMVATENRHLWNRLSKLTHANTSLGNQLLRIKDTLSQHSLGKSTEDGSEGDVVQAQTFTYESLNNKVKRRTESNDQHNNVSLEEISLKLIDSFLKEKSELEQQYAQMVEIQSDDSINSNSIGFAYIDDDSDSSGDLKQYSEKLGTLKEEMQNQQSKLKIVLEALIKIKKDGNQCKKCNKKSTEVNVPSKSLIKSPPKTPRENPVSPVKDKVNDTTERSQDRLCPMCAKIFRNKPFKDFQIHVEEHFVGEDDYLVDNYEIVTNLGT